MMRHITAIQLLVFIVPSVILAADTKETVPLIVVTWEYLKAAEKGWETLYIRGKSALDGLEATAGLCEWDQCRMNVGFGGNPDEHGETTIDAMMIDGVTMDMGAVAGMRRIKRGISVARKVMENTEHTLICGDGATNFAKGFGFPEESLSTNESIGMWREWKDNNCQPNFWKNVRPDPTKSCGPYTEILNSMEKQRTDGFPHLDENNHDTIGIITLDAKGHVAAGTSTNGMKFKIQGRVGDSPIPGAGAYADQEAGAAASTGNGDIMMRFLPSFLAVEEMRRGADPTQAATTAIRRITKHYPKFGGAVIAANMSGSYGAACNGRPTFPFYVSNPSLKHPTLHEIPCLIDFQL